MKTTPFAFFLLLLFLHSFQSTTSIEEPPIPIVFFQHQSVDSLSNPVQQYPQYDSSITALSQRIDSLYHHIETQKSQLTSLIVIFAVFVLITVIVLSIIGISLQRLKKQLLTQQPPATLPVPTVEAITNQPEPQPNEQLQQQSERPTPKRRTRKKTT